MDTHSYSLQGQIALVTGASRRMGLGAAIARELAAAGADICLTYYQPYDTTMPWGSDPAGPTQLLTELQALGRRAAGLPLNLTRPGAAATLFDFANAELGPVDILMANAGVYLAGDLVGNDPAAIDRVLQTNVGAVFQIVRAVLPGMIERGGGDILITSSVAGHQAIPWEPVYSASKHAVQSFTHGLRQQVGPQNIRVQAIAPGIVLNDLWGISDPAEIDAKADAGDGLRSEDVAEAALFMLTRPRNVTIRDLVILPRAQQI